ncbi:MAG TPA: hypothetical protein DHV48_20320 [Prolixibacteraceae bacterium]|nr:hypothetical protein [Prolixibacteraceae bacterium]
MVTKYTAFTESTARKYKFFRKDKCLKNQVEIFSKHITISFIVSPFPDIKPHKKSGSIHQRIEPLSEFISQNKT